MENDMVLAIGVIIFFIGCLMSSVENAEASASRREKQRHEELMRILSEEYKRSEMTTKVTRRRIAKDKEGNILAEEVTEEII